MTKYIEIQNIPAPDLFAIELTARRMRAEVALYGLRTLRNWVAAKLAGLRGAALRQAH